jgi:hypothetical protein
MKDPHETVSSKVREIFAEMAGERADRLDGSVVSVAARDAATAALIEQHGSERAADIAFHMTDWNSDAAFIVALHLFPERFTPDEIDAGFRLFLVHAPNHIREACRLTGEYVWENFPHDGEGTTASGA